jgi:hypothetical protein
MRTDRKKKRMIIAGVAVLVLICATVVSVLVSRPKEETVDGRAHESFGIEGELQSLGMDAGMIKAAENEELILWLDGATSGVVVETKATGDRFYAVPENALNDPRASKNTKNLVNSPVVVTYYSISSQKTVEFDSYTNATAENRVSWAPLENGRGVRVRMVIGREETARLIPEQISETGFEALMERVEAADGDAAVRQIRSLFLKYNYDTANQEQREKYPALEQMDIYCLKTSANDYNRDTLETYFRNIGYTYEEIDEAYEELGYVSKTEAFPCFKMNIDYILDGGRLKVDLDTANIEYDRELFVLTNLRMLPFFGAGETGSEGYVFLPDGSGALINFNNDGSKKNQLTTGRMYGPDAAESNADRGSQKLEFRYPVFGVKDGEKAILGIVTDGDAVSNINCQLGNMIHSYNTAYADFIICQGAQYESDFTSQEAWVQYDRVGYQGHISLEYAFLTGEEADYSGMAMAYQDYLRREVLPGGTEQDQTMPLMLGTLGTVGNSVRVLGIPKFRNVEVTSYKEAAKMVSELSQAGIGNINLRYQAWYNGGYYKYISTKLKTEKAAGSKSDLKALDAQLKASGGRLFLDGELMLGDKLKRFDFSYRPSWDGIRNLFNKQAYYPFMVPTTQRMVNYYYCINPTKLLGYYDAFSRQYEKLGLENISLGTMGRVLNSNYRKAEYTNRQDAEEIGREVLNRADSQYQTLLVDAGNAYTFATADYILNLPDTNSNYIIEDGSVPFIQMALHGLITYAGMPINLAQDYEQAVLKCVEYGSVPYFFLCDTERYVLKNSYIQDRQLYTAVYEDWKDRLVEAYERIDKALSGVQNARMIRHEKLAEDLYASTYDNGTVIYVNYGDREQNAEGIAVPAMDYVVVQEGGDGR